MKFATKLCLVLALAVGLYASADAQARVQVIHNAPDPAAAAVDVYLGDALAIDDFEFRDATEFLELPAGDVTVSIAPPSSQTVDDAIFQQDFTLEDGKNYQIIATGVLSPDDFAANPNTVDTGFQLLATDQAVVEGIEGITTVSVVHGSPDAPTVDVLAPALGNASVLATLGADPLTYGDITMPPLPVPVALQTGDISELSIVPAGDTTVVTSLAVDLNALDGASITVLASGFLSPADNQNGPAFDFIAVFPDGEVASIVVGDGMVQVIHNAADPGAAMVDVYLNGDLAVDDFMFRTATPYLTLPTGPYEVAIAPPSSTSAEDAIFTDSFTVENGRTYQIIATGVLDPSQFAANPDDVDTSFQLTGSDEATSTGVEGAATITVYHGITDAPTVDIVAPALGGTSILTALGSGPLSYGELTFPLEASLALQTGETSELNVIPAGLPETVVAMLAVDLRALETASVLVMASGFLDPAANQDGPAADFIAVFADGTTASLVVTETDVEQIADVPASLTLDANYPNPFNPTTTFEYGLTEAGPVTVQVFDTQGRLISTLVDTEQLPATYRVTFDASDLPSGSYLYRLTTPAGTLTRTMLLV
ncbi:MAG: DUF4397 domain-containing protein, partial [Bacteroidota bacterium]